MRLISWNVAGRVKKLPQQIAALEWLEPDVVALQEVTVRQRPDLSRRVLLVGGGVPR